MAGSLKEILGGALTKLRKGAKAIAHPQSTDDTSDPTKPDLLETGSQVLRLQSQRQKALKDAAKD